MTIRFIALALLTAAAAPAHAQDAQDAQAQAAQDAQTQAAQDAPAQAAQDAPAQAAQDAQVTQAREAGAGLVVFHAVFGPGDAVWEKFGHNALWIHDATTGSTISYNYGMFDFAQPGFVPRLMRGDMLYSMGVRDADDELAAYSWYNRSVSIQRLNLTPQQAHALREFLEWNWLPENRDYLYDYFRDNCSTRIRDALNHALGGALHDALAGVPTNTTFRWHSLRLTGASVATWLGLVLGLGSPTDRPIDAWEESFVPMELARHLQEVRVPRDGGLVPLVAESRPLFTADRAPTPTAPPARTLPFLLLGIVLAASLVLAGRAARHSRRWTLALAAMVSVWGVANGFFGLILFLLWTATNHVASYANVNLLHVSPVGFVLAVAAPLALLRRLGEGGQYGSSRLAWPAAGGMAAMSVLGVLLNLLPQLQQVNAPLVALVLPVHIGVVLALVQAMPRFPSPRRDGATPLRLETAA